MDNDLIIKEYIQITCGNIPRVYAGPEEQGKSIPFLKIQTWNIAIQLQQINSLGSNFKVPLSCSRDSGTFFMI